MRFYKKFLNNNKLNDLNYVFTSFNEDENSEYFIDLAKQIFLKEYKNYNIFPKGIFFKIDSFRKLKFENNQFFIDTNFIFSNAIIQEYDGIFDEINDKYNIHFQSNIIEIKTNSKKHELLAIKKLFAVEDKTMELIVKDINNHKFTEIKRVVTTLNQKIEQIFLYLYISVKKDYAIQKKMFLEEFTKETKVCRLGDNGINYVFYIKRFNELYHIHRDNKIIKIDLIDTEYFRYLIEFKYPVNGKEIIETEPVCEVEIESDTDEDKLDITQNNDIDLARIDTPEEVESINLSDCNDDDFGIETIAEEDLEDFMVIDEDFNPNSGDSDADTIVLTDAEIISDLFGNLALEEKLEKIDESDLQNDNKEEHELKTKVFEKDLKYLDENTDIDFNKMTDTDSLDFD